MNPALQARIGHAGSYLITAPNDGRIRRDADAFLMAAFCDHGTGCGKCPGCIKYRERSHSDLLELTENKMENAAMVPPFLAKKPFEGTFKAVLIPRVDLMTEQAQNALLKSVEEPPEDTIVVLGATNLKAVLPTILSRCLRFEAQADTENALERLMTSTELPKEKAEILLNVADGDFPGALRLQEKDYFGVRSKARDAVSRLLYARSKATSRMMKALSGPEDLAFTLEVALIYLTDVLNWKYLRERAPIRNMDMRASMTQDSKVSPRRITCVMDRLTRLAERMTLCCGLNKNLALEGTLLEIVEELV